MGRLGLPFALPSGVGYSQHKLPVGRAEVRSSTFSRQLHAVGRQCLALVSEPLFEDRIIVAVTSTERNMPLFISYVSYSNAGIKGMVDKPIDRTSVIGALVEKAGGKLQGAFMTTGQHDAVLVTEFPDGSDAIAIGMVAAASGSISKIETVRAWKMGEFKSIAEKAAKLASSYVPPGK
jgi:uncharacterized protein with GYD domain